jgi:hypothetical protein
MISCKKSILCGLGSIKLSVVCFILNLFFLFSFAQPSSDPTSNSSEMYDSGVSSPVKITIGPNSEHLEKHPIYSKMTLYQNGEVGFSPSDCLCPGLILRPTRISAINNITDKGNPNSTVGWYCIVVDTVEGIPYYLSSPDLSGIQDLKSKLSSTNLKSEPQIPMSPPKNPFAALLRGLGNTGNAYADFAVNMASNILQNADMRQVEAIVAQKLVQYLL